MAGNIKMSAEDKKWQGRSDARTLAEAERIKNDPSRAKLAAKEAMNMLKEQQDNLKAMSKVVGVVSNKRATGSKTSSAKATAKKK